MSNIIPTVLFKRTRRYTGATSEISAIVQRPYVQDIGMKPHGLWYSVGAEWWDWLQYEWPTAWGNWQHVHEIEVDESRLLRIASGRDIEAFGARYAGRGRRGDNIDWRKVEQAGYAGIEIAPYLHDYRMDPDFSWYYGWDVASGCIWDVSIITDFVYGGRLPDLGQRQLDY